MAGGKRIKGITIEIDGETKGLDKALSGIDKQLSKTQTSLNDVNRLLKLDPTNTQLLAQKQQLLQTEIGDTKTRLDALKQADKQAKAQLEAGTLGKDKYDALQREIIDTERKFDGLKEAAAETKKQLNGLGGGLGGLGTKATAAGKKVSGLSKGAGALGLAALGSVAATEELRTDLSFLKSNAANAGVSMDKASKSFDEFNTISGESDSSVEAMANLFEAGFDNTNIVKAVEGVSGAFSQFTDTLKIEGIADGIQETLATGKSVGQFGEYLDRVGIGAENFDAQLAKCTTDAEKQDLVLNALAKGGAYAALETYKKTNPELYKYKQAQNDLQVAVANFAEVIQPVITLIMQFATKLLTAFTSLPSGVQTGIMAIVGAVALLSPALLFFGKMAFAVNQLKGITAIGTLFKGFQTVITTVCGGIKTVVSGLFTLIMAHPVIAVITAIIAIVVVLYNKCAWFRDAVNTILTKVKEFFQGFGDKVSGIKDSVVTAFTNMVTSIKTKAGNIKDSIVDGFNKAIDFITDLPKKAYNWGKDFIQELINGIKSMVSNITSAVSDIAAKIRSFLHFTVPDEGPLVDAPKWMPDMIDLMIGGIKKSQPRLQKAIKGLAGNMQDGITMDAAFAGATAVGSQEIVLQNTVMLDGTPIYNKTERHISRKQQGAMRAKGR